MIFCTAALLFNFTVSKGFMPLYVSACTSPAVRSINCSCTVFSPSHASTETTEAGLIPTVRLPVPGSYSYTSSGTIMPFTATFRFSVSIPVLTAVVVSSEKISCVSVLTSIADSSSLTS